MSMIKRNLRMLLLAAAMLIPVGRLLAAAAPGAAHPPAATEGHAEAGHVEGDERLVPIPPSRDTVISAIWVLIIFVVMLAILYPTAWKNVLAGLKAREERIRGDIAEAEAARAKAEATLKEYNTQLAGAEERIRQMLSNAAADGEKLATNIRMKAQQEAEEIKERSTRDIEATKDAALREIYEKTADLATSVAEKIIRRSLSPADQQDLVRQSLEQLQGANKN
jgi:F-type H+-transporting ATPase subunit b